jgi:hypothetical protein
MLYFVIRDVVRGFPSILGMLAAAGLLGAIILHRRESTTTATVRPAGAE